MLGNLTNKLQSVFSTLTGKSKLTETNIADAVTEVRLALLDADVNFTVVKTFIKRVKDKALGDQVLKSVTPGQQFIKVVHDELVALMGGGEEGLNLQSSPSIIMLCGLQGSGKTTHCAKLANYIKKEHPGKKVLLTACDLQRPAAVEQLKTLGKQINVPVFSLEGEKDPLKTAKAALALAKQDHFDVIIVDTAGRLHIDDELMLQLEKMKSLLQPHEILFVANATTGQDAVNVATEFNRRLSITGSILTLLDGNTRGGAAISIREVTGKPLKFEGIGEKVGDIQIFNPASMADRILGMGDTINLVKKVQEHIDAAEAQKLEKKIMTATFTYDDFLSQMQAVKKMGSLKSLIGMIPGLSNLPFNEGNEKDFFKMEAIIQSMNKKERLGLSELTVHHRKRIAKGSGTTLDDVNKLVKSFDKAKQLFKNMPNMKQLEKMMGGFKWR